MHCILRLGMAKSVNLSACYGLGWPKVSYSLNSKASGQCRRPRPLTPDPDPDPNPRQVSTPRHNPHLIRSTVCSFVLHVRVQGVCVCVFCLSCTRACMQVCSCSARVFCMCFVCVCVCAGIDRIGHACMHACVRSRQEMRERKNGKMDLCSRQEMRERKNGKTLLC